jgi:hypothetical protein
MRRFPVVDAFLDVHIALKIVIPWDTDVNKTVRDIVKANSSSSSFSSFSYFFSSFSSSLLFFFSIFFSLSSEALESVGRDDSLIVREEQLFLEYPEPCGR